MSSDSQAKKPKLYGTKPSGNVVPVRILLEEAGIDYDYEEVDIVFAKDQLKPEFLTMNPTHTVPVLKDDSGDIVIHESGAILRYLCNRYKLEEHWYPSAAGERALVDMMLEIRQTWFMPYIVDIFVKSKVGFHPAKTADEEETALRVWENEVWPCFQQVFAKTGGPLLGGTKPNIADIHFYGFWVPIRILNPNWPGFQVAGVLEYIDEVKKSISVKSYESTVGPAEAFWAPFLAKGGASKGKGKT